MLHVGHVRTRGHAPLAHAVRVLARVVLDRGRGAAVGVAFAQDRVHGRAQALGIALLDGLLFVGLGVFRIVRHLVTLALQLADGADQLVHRGADVGQLDDVGVRLLRQLAQLGQVVRHALFFGQEFGELAQDTAGDGDVAGGDVDAGGLGEGLDDREERTGRQQRSFVGQRVDDGGLLGTHCFSQILYRWVGHLPAGRSAAVGRATN
ncbi:hypothetical protein D9M72_474650 [compost metagenome]